MVMATARIKAVFCRGGTSKALIFNAADLPVTQAARDRIFLHALGSPDPYGRQLDGMGGGISSLSKIVIVAPATRTNADVNYTFVQVAVTKPVADYNSMCGNMSAAVGPFAVDEGMVPAADGLATVRVYNTNTDKIYHASFPVTNGKAVTTGNFEIPGVTGTGAQIKLDYLDPGGAATGKLLPTDQARTTLDVMEVGSIEVSLVDAANPVVFARATDLGIDGTEHPSDLDAQTSWMAKLEKIRCAAAIAMGIAATAKDVAPSIPKLALLAAAQPFVALDGRSYTAADSHMLVRFVSMGNIHLALPLTGAMCIAVAAAIDGTLAHEFGGKETELLLGNPSGVLPVQAKVRAHRDTYEAISATTYRTQRRLMEGAILCPSHYLQDAT